MLHVGAGFKEKERSHVVETLSTLGPHAWEGGIPMIWMWRSPLQDRGGKEQRVTLRTSLPGLPPLVPSPTTRTWPALSAKQSAS